MSTETNKGSTETRTYSANEDGSVTIKDSAGSEVRYVKESDLLTVKGSRDELKTKAETAESTAVQLKTEAETARQKALQAEARVSSLEDKIKSSSGSAVEVATLKAQLEAAQKSGEGLSNRFLELRRAVIANTYGIAAEVVNSKDLAALEVFEEALKSLAGSKKLGNFAVGGAGGGANPLENKRPSELARMAYEKK